MKSVLTRLLKKIISDLGVTDVSPQVESPADLSHGDYTTNVAMVLARRLKRSPIEISEEIIMRVKREALSVKMKVIDTFTDQSGQKASDIKGKISILQDINKIVVVPPGFINFHLAASALITSTSSVLTQADRYGMSQKKNGKKIMVEFAHPNTHKAFHIGHLRNISTGESIVRLLESQGHKVIRANYQGDVGMHIAKAIYALLRISKIKDQISAIRSENTNTIVKFLGEAYAAGSKAFENGKEAQEQIKDINYLIYAAVQRFNKERGIEPSSTDYMKFVHGRGVEVDEVYELWKETRQWSLDYFESIYKRVGTHYDRYYFESECLAGVDLAKEAVKKGVLSESDGAIIFNGKPYGLDTRVFVNSLGLPTYEGKELALATTQFEEHGHIDLLIHVLGPEQVSFTQVTFKVEELLSIQKNQQFHLVYGWVKLKQGKMSSRSGNVVLGEWLLDEAKKEINVILGRTRQLAGTTPESEKKTDSGQAQMTRYTEEQKEEIGEKAATAAVKYAFLKVGTRQEIAFDINESVSFEGDSGPYLQYTYARAKSVLRKSEGVDVLTVGPVGHQVKTIGYDLNDEERLVLRLLYKFPEIVAEATENYAPSILCKYLYDLASAFNTFYNKHSILGPTTHNPQLTTSQRLALTVATAQVIKNGLYLLGIETLEQM